jgi:hypothetical protein
LLTVRNCHGDRQIHLVENIGIAVFQCRRFLVFGAFRKRGLYSIAGSRRDFLKRKEGDEKFNWQMFWSRFVLCLHKKPDRKAGAIR